MVKLNVIKGYYLVPKLEKIAICLALCMLSLQIFAQKKAQVLPQAGYYKMKIGDLEITTLSDGSFGQQMDKLLTNIDPSEVVKLNELNFQKPLVELSVNTFLVKSNGKLILIDAGTAELFGPDLGFLPESFRKAGYRMEDVDAILITHMHGDHVGGLINDGKIAFPNATVYVSQKEYDFWLTPKNFTDASAEMKPYFQNAILKMTPYVKAGKVKAFQYGGEILPGVTPIASPGHTPGHSFYEITSQGEKIIFWGDIMHSSAVQFVNQDATIVYDVNPKDAIIARKKAFAEAATNKYWIAADHIAFPGIGHLKSTTTGYRWYPVNFSTTGNGQ